MIKAFRLLAICLALALCIPLFAACVNNGGGQTADLPLITSAPQEATAEPTQVELMTFAPTEAATEAPGNVTQAPTAAPTKTPKPTNTPKPTPTPTPRPTECPVSEDGQYDSKDAVALYIHLFGHLPSNYITKAEANRLGWTGGSLEPYAPGCSIGGDRFGNYEGLLPTKKGRTYYECDIGTKGKSSRGAKRIVFSNDGLIYYSNDHYESFTLLYGGD